MEAQHQFPVQNSYWHPQQSRTSQRVTKRATAQLRPARAMLVIDGAYFEQGTETYLRSKYNMRLLDAFAPDLMLQSFVEVIEEWLNVKCIHKYFITALFEEYNTHQQLLDDQKAMLDLIQNSGSTADGTQGSNYKFEIDTREFKNMAVYCTNKSCKNSKKPINRRVQAEVDVAIATRVLSMAFTDQYDILIAITGDRDFKD